MENVDNVLLNNTQTNGDGLDDLFVRVELNEEESEHIAAEPYSYWKSVFRVFIRKPAAIIAMVVLALLILGIIIIPLFSTPEAYKSNVEIKNLAPSAEHLWGTDISGRDLFFITWSGAGKSLWLAIVSSVIVIIIGTVVGLFWGYMKKIDWLFIEIYNLITNIPSLLIYMLLSIVFSTSMAWVPVEIRLIFSLTLAGWVGIALLIRNQVLIIDNRDYNVASKTLGTPAGRIMFKNYLPYILGVIITEFSLVLPGMVSSEVSLSYFGVGLPSTDISIGALLSNGIRYYNIYPWQILFPALMLAILIFIFFLLGSSLSDSLDPKNHR
ncbi:MAG: ABC transporter permease [Acholeplasmatales bacterium]|nr:ABC transporter permease [Acholeplasmatales bacterium]